MSFVPHTEGERSEMLERVLFRRNRILRCGNS
jgi:hypothetical protein